ncbi:16S rRNA (guanine(966)-N(2))-methyltransferase RsmD [PVC group bacterium (ex Bugula neritina AB1)]|nr:16S rRNA (guanine(966)-N(2))-methyltransferase RsmD [PVC group bacterium (ex Bugula neritina AB1)]
MRIIAGTIKGRVLKVPEGKTVRPTSQRVREAIFSILHSSIDNSDCLDLYAGSGALGIEAFSRGAKSVCFVEKDPQVLTFLKSNLKYCQMDAISDVIHGDVMAQFANNPYLKKKFDLIFIDPPYNHIPKDLLQNIVRHGILSEEGLLILEHGANYDPIYPEDLNCTIKKIYGQTRVSFFKKRNTTFDKKSDLSGNF